MARIQTETRLERVEHVLGSGSGVLDFAIEGESGYYTWEADEATEWVVENVGSVENTDEDRFVIYPEDEYFTCLIEPDTGPAGRARCWCE